MEIVNQILKLMVSVVTAPYFWIPASLILSAMIYQNRRKVVSVVRQEAVLLSVEVPKLSEKGPISAEMMFSAIHGILKDKKELMTKGAFQEYVSFELESKLNSIRFYVWVPKSIKDFVEGQIYAQYPTAVITETNDYTRNAVDDSAKYAYFAGTEIALNKPDYFPIKTFQDFEVDPLSGITGVLSKVDTNESVWMQIIARPIDDAWEKDGAAYLKAVNTGVKQTTMKGALLNLPGEFTKHFIENVMTPPAGEGSKKSAPPKKDDKNQLAESEKTTVKMVAEKLAKLGFQVKVRVIYFSASEELARAKLSSVVASFKQFNTTYLNGFVSGKVRKDDGLVNEYVSRAFVDKGYVLNTAELASLFHLPYASVETPNIVWTTTKKGEPPQDLPLEGSIPASELSLFGQVDFRNVVAKFGIKRVDRPRHMYIVGKSGMGKSELLKLLMISDIYAGKGIALIDPHGDLAEDILKYIPESRMKDVVYINPADKDFPVAFNPLEYIDPDLKYHVASGFVSIFKKIFGFSWGPRLEHIFRYTTLALLEYPNSTTLGVVRMLTDKTFRKKVRKNITDPSVRNFWENEFEAYSEKFANEAVAPILNKVGQFVATPVIRNIIGQPKSTIDFSEIINTNKILLVNLSVGKLGEDNTALIGAMLVTKLHLAAMQRAHIPPEQRKDFYLYVDEFQHFATESFGNILSEARKYKLCLTVANQFIAQMPEEVQNAVFGNIGTLVTFRVGATDAMFLEKELLPVFTKDDLVYLGVQNIYAKLAVDGQTSAPFSANTLTTPQPTQDNTDEIIRLSREKYSVNREEVEEGIMRWQGELDREAREQQEKDMARKSSDRDGGYGNREAGYRGASGASYSDRNRNDRGRDSNRSSGGADRNPRPQKPYKAPEQPAIEVKPIDDFSDFESSKPAQKNENRVNPVSISNKQPVNNPGQGSNPKSQQPTPNEVPKTGPQEIKPGEVIKFDE